ncbi:tetratricopeptide repeat protein [Rhizobium panacihumi]|uniref:tetratricopeptide repeat protein n=1 Tax=Rhizobium panacihumi TaxID=2008450 RepID=UPI003D7959FC
MMAGHRRLLLVLGLIGTMMIAPSASAVDTPPSTDLPDLSGIRAKIYADRYQDAIVDLEALTASVKHADLYNLLGFANRKLKRYDAAAKWYKEALYYAPDHRPALEYQGELFIALGDLDAAQANLDLLTLFCPNGCAEKDTLAKAIASAGEHQH